MTILPNGRVKYGCSGNGNCGLDFWRARDDPKSSGNLNTVPFMTPEQEKAEESKTNKGPFGKAFPAEYDKADALDWAVFGCLTAGGLASSKHSAWTMRLMYCFACWVRSWHLGQYSLPICGRINRNHGLRSSVAEM